MCSKPNEYPFINIKLAILANINNHLIKKNMVPCIISDLIHPFALVKSALQLSFMLFSSSKTSEITHSHCISVLRVSDLSRFVD